MTDKENGTEVPEESEFDSAFAEFSGEAEIKEEIPLEEAITDPEPDPDPKPEDPYAGMTETAMEKYKAMEEENEGLVHKLDSNSGRVSAFQRKVNDLEREIQGIRKGPTAGEQPSTHDIADAMKGTDEDWEQFSTDYPDVAKAIDGRLEKAGKNTQAAVDNTLAPVVKKQELDAENEQTTAAKAAVNSVAETYPKWTDAVKTPEFGEWLEGRPPGVHSLAESADANDALALIGMYDSHLIANGFASLKEANDPGPGVKEVDKPTDLAARRARQLEDGSSIPSKPAGVNTGDDEGLDEFESAFKVFANRLDKKRTA